ncbi:MAG: agmatine deiminase family protein [Candidatus Muirbacterium halophilum]|nr:agmatine deiminase family protein [Candidatus Muirbacterium halophilum]MCK9474365.1 agmatine deiminase family protein [Candidatus Muirbacterium halophilum]
MKKRTLLLALAMVFSASAAFGQVKPLPKSMTEAEKDFITNHYQEYRESKLEPLTRAGLRLPQGNFYGPAEFEPSDGVCFSYMSYTSLIKQLIKFVAEDEIAWVVASGGSSWYGGASAESVKTELRNAGVNMTNVVILEYGLNSVWMRDYGPWWIYTEDGDREVIDFKYNRPRPLDDRFPEKIASILNVKNNVTDLIMPGGNFQLDGHNVAIMTDVVFDPSQGGMPELSVPQLEKYMKQLFNVKKTIILEQMKRDGTGHVDMFSKLLDDKTIIIGEYAKPSDGAEDNYYILNRNAEKMANETNGKGEKFKVIRMPMPRYNGTSYSYTNSLICNNKVLVPIYGFDLDKVALDIYRKALPGYDVRGFMAKDVIQANGAIHCITKMVMKDPLEIRANEIVDARSGEEIYIEFEVFSTKELDKDNVSVYYSNDSEGPFAKTEAVEIDGKFIAAIPAQSNGTEVYYFIEAENINGMYETLPDKAPQAGVLSFIVK